jgi:hypothetical protein
VIGCAAHRIVDLRWGGCGMGRPPGNRAGSRRADGRRVGYIKSAAATHTAATTAKNTKPMVRSARSVRRAARCGAPSARRPPRGRSPGSSSHRSQYGQNVVSSSNGTPHRWQAGASEL